MQPLKKQQDKKQFLARCAESIEALCVAAGVDYDKQCSMQFEEGTRYLPKTITLPTVSRYDSFVVHKLKAMIFLYNQVADAYEKDISIDDPKELFAQLDDPAKAEKHIRAQRNLWNFTPTRSATLLDSYGFLAKRKKNHCEDKTKIDTVVRQFAAQLHDFSRYFAKQINPRVRVAASMQPSFVNPTNLTDDRTKSNLGEFTQVRKFLGRADKTVELGDGFKSSNEKATLIDRLEQLVIQLDIIPRLQLTAFHSDNGIFASTIQKQIKPWYDAFKKDVDGLKNHSSRTVSACARKLDKILTDFSDLFDALEKHQSETRPLSFQ